MSIEAAKFSRWGHIQSHSWPFQVYKLYNEELSGFIWSFEASEKFTFRQLRANGATWDDVPSKHFPLPDYRIATMKSLKGWSDIYDEASNWIRLNCVMAISSNLETYLSSVISLAIESNPGILLKASREIDGVKILKSGGLDSAIYESKVISCVKGTWSSRLAAFEHLFGCAPNSYKNGVRALERMRTLRNNLAHAFGRDIENARNFSVNTKQPINSIRQETLIKYLELGYNMAKDVDSFLLDNYIGEFQAILVYHQNAEELSKLTTDGDRAVALKKIYGRLDRPISKTFCRDLISYYRGIC